MISCEDLLAGQQNPIKRLMRQVPIADQQSLTTGHSLFTPALQLLLQACLHGLKGAFIGSRCRSMGALDGDFGHRHFARGNRNL
jgi:hypothetical protein